MTNTIVLKKVSEPILNKQKSDSLLVKATLMVTSTLTVLAAAIVAPSLPAMQVHFADVENVALLVRLILTIPALFIVIGAPAAGFIVDRFGRKPLLIISTILYGLAGSSSFLIPSLYGILVSRALLGLGVAGVMTSVTTLIADYYVGASRANLLGLQAAIMGLGATIFLTVGGILADLNWRSPFLIYLAAFIVLPFIIQALFEPERVSTKHKISSALTLPSDCVAEAQWDRKTGVADQNDSDARPKIIDLQHEGPSNKIQMPVKVLSLIYGIMILIQIIFYLVPVQLPFYLQALAGANAKQSGLAIAFMTISFSSGSLLSARISKSLNHIQTIVLAFGVAGIGYGIIGLAGSYGLVLVGLAIGGMGFGFVVPTLSVWLTAEVPESLRGRALGALTTFVFLGQFVSPIISQPVIERFDLGSTYLLAGGLLIIVAIFALIRSQAREGQVATSC